MYFMMICISMYLGYSCLYKNMQNESSSLYSNVINLLPKTNKAYFT